MKKREHLLVILAEECAEVAHRVAKALRFGLDETQAGHDRTNGQRIADEMQDLSAAWQMLRDQEHLPYLDFSSIAEKKAKVNRYLEYSESCGTLDECDESGAREHTEDEISDDDVITVARWLPNVPSNEVRNIIRFGLARGLGHAASDEVIAHKIAEAWQS